MISFLVVQRIREHPFTEFYLDIIEEFSGTKAIPILKPRGIPNHYFFLKVPTTESKKISTLKGFKKTPLILFKVVNCTNVGDMLRPYK